MIKQYFKNEAGTRYYKFLYVETTDENNVTTIMIKILTVDTTDGNINCSFNSHMGHNLEVINQLKEKTLVGIDVTQFNSAFETTLLALQDASQL